MSVQYVEWNVLYFTLKNTKKKKKESKNHTHIQKTNKQTKHNKRKKNIRKTSFQYLFHCASEKTFIIFKIKLIQRIKGRVPFR